MGNKDSGNKQKQQFIKGIQDTLEKLKPKLLSKSISKLTTKNWKSQNTTVIIAHLSGKAGVWKECPKCLKAVESDKDIVKQKTASILAVYYVLDDKANKVQIAGKDVFLCVQQSKSNDISALKSPENMIKSTKAHKYEKKGKKANQAINKGVKEMKLDE